MDYLHGGIFRQEKMCRDTNEFVIIDESPGFYVPFFKPHKKWKDITKGTTKYHTEEWIKEHEHGEEHQQRIDK